MKPMKKPIQALFPIASAFLLCLQGAHASAQSFADVRTELVHNDNVTRSERDSDAREDTALALTASAGVHIQPGDYTGLTFTGAVNRTQYRRYSGLSSYEAGFGVDVSHKFGLGDRRPLLNIDVGVARNEYNIGVRDAWVYRAGIGLRKRVTDVLSLSSGLRYEKRDGDHDVPRNIPAMPRSGSSWDIAARVFFVTAELDIGAATWASATYQVQGGDVVSTALSYPKIFDTATAITLDPLFGAATVAYRIPAVTHTVALDLNRAVFDTSTLYVGAELQDTRGKNGIDYDVSLFRAGFIHSF
jgi:hypothetical protein